MNVRYITENDRDMWQTWVMSHPDATFYHRIEWQDVIRTAFKHDTYYLVATEGDRIEGILPLVNLKSMLFGNLMCSMPFLNFGGICANSPEAYQALLAEARNLLTRTGAEYVELRHLQRSPVELMRNEHKVSMTIDLDPDPDVLWNKFKSKHRTNIRRAQKNGLEIVRGGQAHLEPFYRILSAGWRDLGTPLYRIGFFKSIFEHFGDAVEIYMVYYRGEAIATAFNGLFRDTVEGMWTYSLREYAKLQTNYLLYWEMIKNACLGGYRFYHLGRSTSDGGGVFFKSKWNASLHQLYWEYILNENKTSAMPQLNVDNPKYQLAIKTWRKLPVMVTNRIGPLIARSIP